MLNLDDSTYWIALAHLLKWETEKVNRLIIDVLHKKSLSFSEFFQLNKDTLMKEFRLKPEELRDLIRIKVEVPNLSFLLESIYAQGFEIIKLNSPEYPRILKDSLKIKYSPPLLYTKGNKQLLQIPSMGIVGARNSSKVSLRFAESIAEKCVENNFAVVIGSAKNLDRVMLNTVIKNHGYSIVILPQGIMTFDFQEYFSQVISGDILFISMYSPKEKWSNDNATNRNILIYGLTQGVYISQANLSGGTWAGAIFGLEIGKKVYVRQGGPEEKNANNLLLLKGAISVDSDGNGFQIEKVDKKPLEMENREEKIAPVSEAYKRQITKVDRQIEEGKLKDIFHIDSFYDRQWEVIEKLLNGERILLVEKTGFGKSLCYQYTATQWPGMTVVFSPLIALMRDQVSYLQSLGIPSECINSEQTLEENRRIIKDAQEGKIKILYIAPERQENQEWIDAVQKMDLSMVVVDEAHCISIWGHDFRPAFRRVVNLVRLLPDNFPVLATTATATNRVANDVSEQIGGSISILRGKLLRENFYLRVVKVEDENEKMVWLGEFLQAQEGNGLIYTGTRANTDIYANWLQYIGISATSYNAGFDGEWRKEIEQGLKSNRWKCIVSTNALGMGIDKPDIRFIVHTQIPSSPIHYYQEIGRAGRDGLPTEIVLLYNPADKELPEFFIESCRPSTKDYWKVIEILIKGSLGQLDLIRLSNLNRSQIRTILTDLIEQGIIKESMQGRSKKYEYQFDAPSLNVELFQTLRLFKFEEFDKIVAYAESRDCRMDYLCNYLGDPSVIKCGKCDNDLGQIHKIIIKDEWKKKIQDFWESYFPEIKVESSRSNMINGVASSYYGVSNIGKLIHHCKYENGGDFPDQLLDRTIKAYKKHFDKEEFQLIVHVPPTESGKLVENFAKKVGKELNIPVSDGLKKKNNTKPQKAFQNSILKSDNVKDAFYYENPSEIKDKSILVIDDVFDSGATIREIGKMFTHLGAKKISPLVIAKTVGGDLRDE